MTEIILNTIDPNCAQHVVTGLIEGHRPGPVCAIAGECDSILLHALRGADRADKTNRDIARVRAALHLDVYANAVGIIRVKVHICTAGERRGDLDRLCHDRLVLDRLVGTALLRVFHRGSGNRIIFIICFAGLCHGSDLIGGAAAELDIQISLNIAAGQNHLIGQLLSVKVDDRRYAGGRVLHQRHQAVNIIAVLIHAQLERRRLIQCQRYCYLAVFGIVMLCIHSGRTDQIAFAINERHTHRAEQIQKTLLVRLCGCIKGIAAAAALRGAGRTLHLIRRHLSIAPHAVHTVVAHDHLSCVHFGGIRQTHR